MPMVTGTTKSKFDCQDCKKDTWYDKQTFLVGEDEQPAGSYFLCMPCIHKRMFVFDKVKELALDSMHDWHEINEAYQDWIDKIDEIELTAEEKEMVKENDEKAVGMLESRIGCSHEIAWRAIEKEEEKQTEEKLLGACVDIVRKAKGRKIK